MDYDQWIERQRCYRLKTLAQAPEVAARGLLRLCADCGEVCLCHETSCPNCGGQASPPARLAGGLAEAAGRIRCLKRFAELRDDPGE
jgi:hypothetical protein